VTQEGFGRDAVALPVDELGSPLGQSPVSQGLDPAALPGEGLAPDAETGETLSPLAAFLTHAALESGDNQAQAGQDAIQLMTVHAAKGLEFDGVFITGMEEGLFPHENAMSDYEGLERRAPPDVCGHHAGPQAPVPEPFADPACCMARPATTSGAVFSTNCPRRR
jgi:DNA helicase-2/ATP-dependent DNA helicase PcrA